MDIETKKSDLSVKSENGEDFELQFTGTGQGLVDSIAMAILSGGNMFNVPPLEILSDVTKRITSHINK